MSATATDFSFTASSVGTSEVQLQGTVSSGTLTFTCAASSGSYAAPAHGLLSDFDATTGIVLYTPNSGFTGTDTFQFAAIQNGSTTSSTATCTVTVTSAKTTISDYLLKPDGTSRAGTITAFLTQTAVSSGGIVPASASVSATVNATTGAFTLSLYPSRGLSPQAYYQLWWGETNNLRKELIGIYDIPASNSSILLSPYQVTDANLATRYTFVSLAAHRAAVAADEAIQILNNGSAVGTRPTINFIPGSNISYTIADNSGSNRVDLTINGPAGGGTGGSVNSGAAGKLAYYASTGTTVGSLAFGTANQVLGMNSGATAYEHKTVTAGSGISVTHGTNSITIANAGVNSINSDSSAAHTIQIGSSGSAPAVSTLSGVTTVSIPAASTTAGGYVTVGTQSIAGQKTFTGNGASDIPLIAKDKASGSGVTQQWQDSGGTVYGTFYVADASSGGLYANKLAAGNTQSSPLSGYVLAISDSQTSDGKSGMLLNTGTSANGTTGNLRGLFITYSMSGSGSHVPSASRTATIDANFTYSGSGSAASIQGVRSQLTHSNTGTTTAWRSFLSTGEFSGGGTVTSFTHFYAAAPIITSTTFTNQYGIYVESLTGATNNWALYTAGTTGSSLGGFLDLRGRSAPGVSNSGEVRLYSDTGGSPLVSLNGGAYSYLLGVPVIAKTSNYSILASDIKTRFTNAGASGTVVLTLPTAVAGMVYAFYVLAAQTLTITAGTGATIRNAASVSSSAGTASASTVGNVIVLTAVSSTSWITESVVGSWSLA